MSHSYHVWFIKWQCLFGGKDNPISFQLLNNNNDNSEEKKNIRRQAYLYSVAQPILDYIIRLKSHFEFHQIEKITVQVQIINIQHLSRNDKISFKLDSSGWQLFSIACQHRLRIFVFHFLSIFVIIKRLFIHIWFDFASRSAFNTCRSKSLLILNNNVIHYFFLHYHLVDVSMFIYVYG